MCWLPFTQFAKFQNCRAKRRHPNHKEEFIPRRKHSLARDTFHGKSQIGNWLGRKEMISTFISHQSQNTCRQARTRPVLFLRFHAHACIFARTTRMAILIEHRRDGSLFGPYPTERRGCHFSARAFHRSAFIFNLTKKLAGILKSLWTKRSHFLAPIQNWHANRTASLHLQEATRVASPSQLPTQHL